MMRCVVLMAALACLQNVAAETRCEFKPDFDLAIASINPAELQLGQWKGVASPEECADICCTNDYCDYASFLQHQNENICIIARCPQEDSCKWAPYSGGIKLQLIKKFDVDTTTVTQSQYEEAQRSEGQASDENSDDQELDRGVTSLPITTSTEPSVVHDGPEDLGTNVNQDNSQGYPWMTDNNFGPEQTKETGSSNYQVQQETQTDQYPAGVPPMSSQENRQYTTIDEVSALDNALNPEAGQSNGQESAKDKELQDFLQDTNVIESALENQDQNKPETLGENFGARKNITLFNAYFTEIKETGPLVTVGICFGVFFLLLILAIAGKKVATLSTLKTRVHYKPLRDDSIYQKSYSDE